MAPWVLETLIPSFNVYGYTDVEAIGVSAIDTRSYNNSQEIWFRGALAVGGSLSTAEEFFFIYYPSTQGWEHIPATMVDSTLIVTDILVGEDETIWGVVKPERPDDVNSAWDMPILSRFDEANRRFILPEATLRVEVEPTITNLRQPEIVVSEMGAFLIVVDDLGIYEYDPNEQNVELLYSFDEEFKVISVTLAPDGSLYVHRNTFFDANFRFSDDTIFQFHPSTGELLPLDMPEPEWPISTGILFGSDGRLWLGASGYREANGDWELLHADPQRFFENIGQPTWGIPHLMLQSSDGRLWYQISVDGALNTQGTAWYDPTTSRGCMFTNIPATIVEDEKSTLWMVVDNGIYSQSLP